jgi:hypothetical protein
MILRIEYHEAVDVAVEVVLAVEFVDELVGLTSSGTLNLPAS